MARMRVLLGEVVVEVETAEDAVRVAQAYAQATTKPPTATTTSAPTTPALYAPRVVPPAVARQPQSNNRYTTSNGSAALAHVVFKKGHYPAFEGLYAAASRGVDSEALTKLMGLPTVKSLPPTIGAWGKRAASVGLDLSELLEVDRGYANGKPHTIYRLTARGREVFRPDTEQAQAGDRVASLGL